MGSFLSIYKGFHRFDVITLAVLTTLFLQILSNLANDYGDGVKGTDNENRIGPLRTIQSGIITPKEMRVAIAVFILLSLLSGVSLIVLSLGENWISGLVFLAIGIMAIVAAIKYTIGQNAYGYKGLGDIFVFIFFGPVAVLGVYYLATLSFSFEMLLPAITLGLLSTGVLNLNNMRDMDNDLSFGKNTLALSLGFKKSKVYHTAIISVALLLPVVFSYIIYASYWNFIFLLSYPLFITDLISIYRISDKRELDKYLKKLALSTLLFTFLFGIGLIIS